MLRGEPHAVKGPGRFFERGDQTSKRMGTLRISRAQAALARCAYSLKPSVMPPEDNAGAVPAPNSTRKDGDAKDRLAKNDSYGFFGESRLDLPYVEIARAEVGEKDDQAALAAFFSSLFFVFSSVASAACSTRSIRVTSARGALSPLRKPVFRIRR